MRKLEHLINDQWVPCSMPDEVAKLFMQVMDGLYRDHIDFDGQEHRIVDRRIEHEVGTASQVRFQ